MKFVVTSILAFCLTALYGCFSPEQARNCTTTNGEPVICSQPVNLKGLMGQPERYIEIVVGKQDGSFISINSYKKNFKNINIGSNMYENMPSLDIRSYGGGRIYVNYNNQNKATASLVYPDNLDFDKASILRFLSAEGVSVDPTFSSPQNDPSSSICQAFRFNECRNALTWENDPYFSTFSAFANRNQPDKVHFIIQSSKSNDARLHLYYVHELSGMVVKWRNLTKDYLYGLFIMSCVFVLVYRPTEYRRIPILFHLPWAIVVYLFTGDTEEISTYGTKEFWRKILVLFVIGIILNIVIFLMVIISDS